jgi:CRP/FNR family nitrogen fixation transcriptional regulator
MFGAVQTILHHTSSVQADESDMSIANLTDGSTATNDLRSSVASGEFAVDRRGYEGDLHATGRARHFIRDREIYTDGNDAEYVFKVEAGVVRTYKFLRDGRRQVDAFHGPGNVFGLEIGAKYSFSAAAASDCVVISYRRSSLEKLAVSNEQLSLQLFSSALRSLARAREHSLSLGRRTAVEKVAAFLLGCTEHTRGGDDVFLAMTRKDIADHLGLTIETVSRTLAKLEERSLIRLVGTRQVRLTDTSALKNLCA